MISNVKKPIIISGPCSVESRDQVRATCLPLVASGEVDLLRGGVWKPRTRPGAFEGIGEVGLEWLGEIKKETGIGVMVEVASTKHVEAVLKNGIDIVWIGARSSVNPFTVEEIAQALRGCNVSVMVKNPVCPDVDLWTGAIERVLRANVREVGMIHRGFATLGSTGLRNNPLWPLAGEMRNRFKGMVMVCDPSHICGTREHLKRISQLAADLQYDGLMIESHCCPSEALSDGAQQLMPLDLLEMLKSLRWNFGEIGKENYLLAIDRLRDKIDQYDVEIMELLASRMRVVDRVGVIKKENGVEEYQKERWDGVVAKFLAESDRLGLSEEFLIEFLDTLHRESLKHQTMARG